MELKQAIEILKAHNEWRRGAEIPMTDPTTLGIAIDCVVENFDDKFEGIAQAYETGFAQGQEVGKRETIDKACDWLEYHEGNLVVFMGDATTDAIEEFRKAMEAETCNSGKNLQELTWRDVERIVEINYSIPLYEDFKEQHYREVLRRFNEGE